jgi:hypothetical protein
MIGCLPNPETIDTALSLAARAPSIDDSQPWKWSVGTNSLHLYIDPDRHGSEVDAESRDVLVGCGVSLHHFLVALSALGWRAKVARLPDAAEPGLLADLELYPHPASGLDVVLAAAIPRHRSDWRPYNSWPVSAADMALIGARAAHAGVTMRRVESLPEVQDIVAQAVRRHAPDYEHDGESTTRSGRYASVVDIRHRNTPGSGPAVTTVDPPFADSAAQPPGLGFTAGNGVVVALGTNDDSRLARLRAGEATSLVLLSATALGLASCLVVERLTTAAAQDALQAKLFGLVGFPQTLLRIGWPPVNADPLPSPPHRR